MALYGRLMKDFRQQRIRKGKYTDEKGYICNRESG